MDTTQLASSARGIIARLQLLRPEDQSGARGAVVQASEFLRQYAGAKSEFYKSSESWYGLSAAYAAKVAVSTLNSFIEYVEAGLSADISPERQAQLDVVSDLLDQANTLLDAPKVHAAAPAVLVGATLEEFLRTWVESTGLSLGNRKPGLENYSQILRDADLINKQDAKDITAWAGLRNHAAHGEWDLVSDKNRVRLMLEGVNLFMRKYGGS